MRKIKYILYTAIIFLTPVILYLIFHTPSQLVHSSTVIDPNQLGYLGLLQNPIIQILLCLSLIIMLSGIHYVHKIFNERKFSDANAQVVFFILILGLFGTGANILWLNWTYVSSSFTIFMSMLLYESYNPLSVPIANRSDYISYLLPRSMAMGINCYGKKTLADS